MLIKKLSFNKIKIVGIKISQTGKKTILKIIFIIVIITNTFAGVKINIMSQRIYTYSLSPDNAIERVSEVPTGGSLDQPWSVRVRYTSKSSRSKTSRLNLRRRLFGNSNSGPKNPNKPVNRALSVNTNRYLSKPGQGRGKGITVFKLIVFPLQIRVKRLLEKLLNRVKFQK